MKILFTLWKDRNVVLFTHNFLDINVSMYTKACICNHVILQIQVQATKMALEVAHLQELLQHWGNAPCVVSRVLLDISTSDDRSLPCGHHHSYSFSACRSQMLCS